MIYRTTDRFVTPSTIVNDDFEPIVVEIDSYKTDTVITNESLAKPFEQIKEAFTSIQTGGENVRN